jgi:hypothetical protein
MSKKKEMKSALRQHQPSGGGYGVPVLCSCGEDFSADHQIERVLAAWAAEDKWNARKA